MFIKFLFDFNSCSGVLINNCSSCPLNANRNLTSNTCVCNNGFYDDGASISCQPCHFSCAKCNGPNNNNCTTCNAAHKRSLSKQIYFIIN